MNDKETFRTHTCGELTSKNIGKKAILSGWVNTRRDHGGVIFIDLRDKFGLTQIVLDSKIKALKDADKLRREFCVKVIGTVRKRPEGTINKNLSTGEVEIVAEELIILNKSEALPFDITSKEDVSEELRLKYRFLDLRRKRLQDNLAFRAQVIKFLRDWMFGHGFTEVETPILTVSSPEGARDFLVPSRLHPGKFYALPQAPQQYKQLLMVAGMDKYFQVAPCMRDEDARADRSPGEFYQLDTETSFLTQDEFFDLMEPMLIEVTEKFSSKKVMKAPFPRIPFKEAMLKYGSDKPDLRFGLEIIELSSMLKDCGFDVFKKTIKEGGVVRALCATGAAKLSRGELDAYTDLVKGYGLGGLAQIILKDKAIKSPLDKFLGSDIVKKIILELKAKDGDVIFIGAGKESNVATALGNLRKELGKNLNLIDQSVLAWLWIVDFPMYELKDGKIEFAHNPFSMPQGGMGALEKQDPLKILAYQYDIVCNGIELSSGAVRNNVPEIMYKAFKLAGYGPEVVDKKFGHMIAAFKYGAPPHCGFAPGIERLVMVLRGESNIREITAFPKNSEARDVMMSAPSEVDEKQLRELHIKIDLPKKEEKAEEKKEEKKESKKSEKKAKKN
jgi:aspartyl-tRNA synthetase